MKMRSFLLVTAGAACIAVPSSAAGAVTVGANLDQGMVGSCGAAAGQPCSVLTLTETGGAPETGSPVNGILTSARIRTTGPAATVAVRVLHLNAMVANSYLNIGPETHISVAADATLQGHVSEATGLHHPIRVGDVLGVGFTQPALPLIIAGPALAGGTCAYRQGAGSEHPVNEEKIYDPLTCNTEVLVQGTVEPDADGDGFGDETQDLCPTQTATQGNCPATPPLGPTGQRAAALKKCKKKKSKKARKKCKKRALKLPV